MTDMEFDPGPDALPEMALAAEFMSQIAPVCNKWLVDMIARREPANHVLAAMSIAFATELSMLIGISAKEGRREAVARTVADNISVRLLHSLDHDNVPQTPEATNGSDN